MRRFLALAISALAFGFATAEAQQTKDYSIYFGWDKGDLPDLGADIISVAVSDSRDCGSARFAVVGHDDTSQSPERAKELSLQRANAVRSKIIDFGGIDPSFVTAEGRGDTDLARPTRDGVREPLNRRAIVTLTCK